MIKFQDKSELDKGNFDLSNILIKRMSELFKKIWNPKNFKGIVSPHEIC